MVGIIGSIKGSWKSGENAPLTLWNDETGSWDCVLCQCPWGRGHPTGNQHKRKLRWYNCDLESTVNELLEVETMILQQRGHFPEEVETGPPDEKEEEAIIAEDL